MNNETTLSALEAARLEPRCECEEGEAFCPLHDDEDDAVDWEKDAEERAELREERDSYRD